MALKYDFYKVVLRLTGPMLGTVPVKKDVYTTFIAGKAADFAEKSRKASIKKGEDPDARPAFTDGSPATDATVNQILVTEQEGVQEMEEKGWTSFLQDTGGRYLLSYVMRGMLKAAASALKEYGDGPKPVKQLADKITKYGFIHERKIRIAEVPTPEDPDDYGSAMLSAGPNGPMCERPLRAQTPMGPRVTVVRSDAVLEGATLTFHLKILHGGQISKGMLEDLFEYGTLTGLGQWRSSGCAGTFVVDSFDKVDELPELPPDPLPIRKPKKVTEKAQEEPAPTKKSKKE